MLEENRGGTVGLTWERASFFDADACDLATGARVTTVPVRADGTGVVIVPSVGIPLTESRACTTSGAAMMEFRGGPGATQ